MGRRIGVAVDGRRLHGEPLGCGGQVAGIVAEGDCPVAQGNGICFHLLYQSSNQLVIPKVAKRPRNLVALKHLAVQQGGFPVALERNVFLQAPDSSIASRCSECQSSRTTVPEPQFNCEKITSIRKPDLAIHFMHLLRLAPKANFQFLATFGYLE